MSINNDLLGAIITGSITGIISIIGFIITNKTMKANFQNEMKRQRDAVSLGKMEDVPYEVLSLFDDGVDVRMVTNDKAQAELQKKHKVIINTIYSYGTEDAIKIASMMQKESYANTRAPKNNYRIMAYYLLLATQIKYDVTQISISPKLWYQMKISDYSQKKEDIVKANNELVMELGLREEFLIN